ncbi:MAG: aminotransferase class I/II-fold pyridoxal phosphate-dependent enzyme [Waddliaceae bacterium]
MKLKVLQLTVWALILNAAVLVANPEPTIYLLPNTTQLFTELYQAHGLLTPPQRTFFESALYLDQSTDPSIIPFQPSNRAILDHTDQVLSQFHETVGDMELYIDPKQPRPFFYTGTGSKQLIVALVYGIAMSEPDKKFLFVEKAPYYSGHPNAVTGIYQYPNVRFLPFHEPSEITLQPGEELVEFVTSPNNPDGTFRKPLTDAKIIIADFVFASSAFGETGTGYIEENIEWMREARASGKHIFSFNSASKQFGKTGARCGYIWYPIHDPYAASIFRNFFNFISYSTVAGGTSGIEDFLDLIKAMIDLPDIGKSIRSDAYKSLVKRHELLEKEFLKRYPGSDVTSIPGSPTFFAKMNDSRIPQKNASDVIFEDLNIRVNVGEPMGETSAYIRLNLSGYSALLVETLNRLAGENKYSSKEVLFLSKNVCRDSADFDVREVSTSYIVKPGDCRIQADATQRSIEIELPPFVDYISSNVIRIKKVDTSENPVVISSKDFAVTLKSSSQTLNVQWVQPLYFDGHWKILSPGDNND